MEAHVLTVTFTVNLSISIQIFKIIENRNTNKLIEVVKCLYMKYLIVHYGIVTETV